jgi:hypothetical protein
MLASRKDETLVHLASRVVVATVTRVPVPRALGRAVIDVEFQVERALKGTGGASGLLRIAVPYHVSPGGILPSFNFPHFTTGERYAIFLSRRDVPLEFVHLRGVPVSHLDSIEAVTAARPVLPPSRNGQRDSAFGRVPISVVCTSHPMSVQLRHEAHLAPGGESLPEGVDRLAFVEELGAAAAMWNGIADVVVVAGPHGRFEVGFTRELPMHGSGLAVTDWQARSSTRRSRCTPRTRPGRSRGRPSRVRGASTCARPWRTSSGTCSGCGTRARSAISWRAARRARACGAP